MRQALQEGLAGLVPQLHAKGERIELFFSEPLAQSAMMSCLNEVLNAFQSMMSGQEVALAAGNGARIALLQQGSPTRYEYGITVLASDPSTSKPQLDRKTVVGYSMKER